ncbi:acyltransferase [Vibrio vulnificus]|uniref:acyltransferase family protein n=1 Tax=Vibrio vulnificus TaxID=672 RepID=UPI0019D436C0|nr:acyltransferase [Vibrio vulnificus]MBN8135366.1 acyltransferase [Vibrio vulnificus]HDY7659516.1 acyltransferase [Vibrio vulnificus]
MYYNNINALRGIAAVGVLLYHYMYHYFNVYNEEGGYSLFALGKFGVNLFFLISGFLIISLLLKNQTSLRYFLNRATRLLPSYFIAATLTFLTLKFFNDEVRSVSFYDYILNLLIFPSLFDAKYVDGSYWTLEIEWMFYIYAMFSYFIYKKNRTMSIIFVSTMVILSSLSSSLIFLKGYIPYFVLGLVFYFWKNAEDDRKIYKIIGLLTVCIILVNSKYPLIEIGIVLLFYFAMYEKINVLNNKITEFFASISYSLYLLHQNIGYVLINKLSGINIPHFISFLIVTSIIVFLSYLLTFITSKIKVK